MGRWGCFAELQRCCASAHLSDIDGISQEMMYEFEIVLTPMPYVGRASGEEKNRFQHALVARHNSDQGEQ